MGLGQFTIYKGMSGKHAAVQATLGRANLKVERKGAVFLEIAPTVGPNKYDWENKMIFALGVGDIQQIVGHDFRGGDKLKLIHKKDDNIKSMNITPGNNGTLFFAFYGKAQNGNDFETSLPVSRGEWRVFTHLLLQSVPAILAWGISYSKD